MGKVISGLFMVVGIVFVLTGLSVALIPEASAWIISVLAIEDEWGFRAFWLLANWWTLLIGGGVLFWIGKSLRD